MADKDNNKYTDEEVRNLADLVFDKLKNLDVKEKQEAINELKTLREKNKKRL